MARRSHIDTDFIKYPFIEYISQINYTFHVKPSKYALGISDTIMVIPCNAIMVHCTYCMYKKTTTVCFMLAYAHIQWS